jgi:hypothetical protein
MLLTAFGLFACTAMVICYAMEARATWFVLGFAVSCLLAATYGFLQGAWPFGVVELVWAGVALNRYRLRAIGKDRSANEDWVSHI